MRALWVLARLRSRARAQTRPADARARARSRAAPGQEVLDRSSVLLLPDGSVECRFTVALPARGRTVMGRAAHQALCVWLPEIARTSLCFGSLDADALEAHCAAVEDQRALREWLPTQGLVAFVADGAVLPRASGANDEPMRGAVPFESPGALRVEASLPNAGTVSGMGVRTGVSLIVGGGFHGKSTLLKAIERGVYDHVPGDGRELVVTADSAAKIRAEDGRSVSGVDISPFIANLPYGKDTADFSTGDASGSTSQATNIVEALEAGSRLLLLDEDTCATNFMVRDERMAALVAADREPITPFIARVRALAAAGVSCVMVIGGCGEYFSVAEGTLRMDSFRCYDATAEARDVVERFAAATGVGALALDAQPLPPRAPRRVDALVADASAKCAVRAVDRAQIGELEVDLGGVEQLVDKSQTRAVIDAVCLLQRSVLSRAGTTTLPQLLDHIEEALGTPAGLDSLAPGSFMGNYVRPRRVELAAAVNRLRSLRASAK